ncbi:NAD-dependent epimerase/dehydratase family protein [Synechococcus sp. Cruz CV12-2-Slac-r]|uniref:NAD-dependent epimerase/dehydratase family protein n=1 Tax=Synechococcus sp. Cruz CV12-2-Slac-r TaxID=2823748 RepID=UPI0020CDF2DD|nr:NAD-dependent epimerase/dehydratase family protein [Synechococcus sp. Cruz CV12-2-Slac-r]MCP9938691.1 NAD-dependent epimerase/dehydratase family protein [Synechococcus sp. Cruz CV12-2-Slac-r]MCX5929982.1 NAD-dependent epimerase/dehydratase family protein [Synechococcus sp. LacPavin_0920_WC12_MAG_50_7]
MRILLMGGTRFIGKPLVQQLLAAGHQLTLFTRGRQPIPAGVLHLSGDRNVAADLAPLQGQAFEVIIDSSGRTMEESQAVLACTGAPSHRFVYVSSAGVYADSELWPLDEESPLDPSSRHAGKACTEDWLRQQGIPFTSFRPTYIYGPGNYNPVENWFFARICQDLAVPLPGDGSTITQLGHVDDLAMAMARCLEVDASINRIYNCTGSKGVSFRGLVAAAARACGKDPSTVEMRSFDPSCLDPKARKAFPLRLNHFLVDVHRLERELAFTPRFDLDAGLADSFKNDYGLRPDQKVDCSSDALLWKN